MPRTASSEFLRRKAEPKSTPLEIWDIHLGSSAQVDSNTLFFVVTNQNIRYYAHLDGTPQTYIGVGITRSPIARHIDSKIDSLELGIDNVDRTFSAYFNDIDLRGKRIVIRKVFADYLNKLSDPDGDNFVVIFDGIIDAPTLNQSRISAQARNNFFNSLTFVGPRRTYQGVCNYRFGSSGDCAAHRTQQELFDPRNGTIDEVPSQIHFRDSDRTEGTSGDYWAPGIMRMLAGTAGNIGVKRRVVQSTASGDLYIEASFPYFVQPGDAYEIQRDCGHTLDRDCRDRFQNNSEFGGFITIPDNLVRRE